MVRYWRTGYSQPRHGMIKFYLNQFFTSFFIKGLFSLKKICLLSFQKEEGCFFQKTFHFRFIFQFLVFNIWTLLFQRYSVFWTVCVWFKFTFRSVFSIEACVYWIFFHFHLILLNSFFLVKKIKFILFTPLVFNH